MLRAIPRTPGSAGSSRSWWSIAAKVCTLRGSKPGRRLPGPSVHAGAEVLDEHRRVGVRPRLGSALHHADPEVLQRGVEDVRPVAVALHPPGDRGPGRLQGRAPTPVHVLGRLVEARVVAV